MGEELILRRLICIVLLVFMVTSVFTSCGYSVPKPEIESGEFSFSVTYELNGVKKTISGVYVCEYDGTDWALDGGFSRDWTGYFKDNEIEEPITIGTTKDGEEMSLSFGFYPEYFMDDFIEGVDEIPTPEISVTHVDEGLWFEFDADVIEEKYGAKIISYQYDEPIKNTFK